MNKPLTPKERSILAILTSSRRSMTSKQISEELKKMGIKISRPTVAKYLDNLKKKGYVKEYHGTKT